VPVVDITEAQKTRTLCILLVLRGLVSFRSVPRILELFNTETPLKLEWVPHFCDQLDVTFGFGNAQTGQTYPHALGGYH